MDEWIDILDEVGNGTGEVRLKSEAHRDGLWHRCFHCWVVHRPENGEPSLLLQRRAMQKDTWPGRLDVSVGGHLAAGETILDGRREISEELGLEAPAGDLIALGERRVERTIAQGTDREFHGVFLFITEISPATLRLQPEEVDSLACVTLSDADKLPEGETVPATIYRNGAAPEKATVGLSEFVDDGTAGDYLAGVLEFIRRALPDTAGGRMG
ncbi:NUDIX hydrolase [Rubrobacter indicoceani]|uniref:NUDIX hydrolase n=1 Tax=Rubrobacter indicoceani TaxID=2051957 RepID=UPI000E5BA996|nr:NUDIX domain-containing protein [Rubrobacter indicoceani]